ncbi:MAG: valine--tRNA ligase [Verrucomicrobiales bacterium]|nr:valine--tRNA ligase [Verrucomicrobiales bacterium]
MSEIPKAYEPQSVEDKWYAFWQQHDCFKADPARVTERRPAYSIVIPPPNVTGVLTLGHVLNNTIQDILARKARMEGKEVLWLPGTDHAGIATQTVVERTLKKQGAIKHRDDLGREKFLEKVWEWKEKHGGIIIQQLKKIGASCDWSRERFTMDPEYSRCVQHVFVDLYRKGLIYRGKRMVNWCPASLTALSDEEVVMQEQKGSLYYFKVEVVEEPGTWLTIATTRPETIPADTAVAVNPKDPRYARLIGKHVRRALPIENQAHLPIVADDHIDPEFGTGVLKVTPAHDRADFDIGLRHQLPVIDVLNANGTMNDLAGKDLAGLDRFAARKKAAEILEAHGTLEKAEPYANNVGFSERAGVPIEPRLSEQWFLKYPATQSSQSCVAQGSLRFHPDRWAKVYDHWMAGIQDWCISRQLWWGHRIPVWTLEKGSDRRAGFDAKFAAQLGGTSPGATTTAHRFSFSGGSGAESWVRFNADNGSIHAATLSAAEEAKLVELGFVQDPDVLDTWFSSWLWPFATMGWVGESAKDNHNATLKAFYPTADLVTGPDIIFFWVARMIMAGYEFMGEMPFRNVYFTGIIRDKQGRKMSKSLGNSPDPLDLVSKYGADALRFGVMRSAPLGQDVIYDELNVELGRNFCNKLWNACRFRQMQGGDVQAEIRPDLLTNDDRWILLRLDQALREIERAYEAYRFSEVTQTLYRFFWSEYCDWYVEASKAAFFGEDTAIRANKLAVIDFVLSHTLRLFHPFLPFITEELWHGLGYAADMPAQQGGLTLMTAPWPQPLNEDEKLEWGLEESVDQVANAKIELVGLGRNLRALSNVPANKKVRFVIRPSGDLPDAELATLRLLLNADPLERATPDWKPEKGTAMVSNNLADLYLPLAGLIDTAAERSRLGKELEKVDAEIAKVQEKLANPNFTQKVPAKVLQEHQQRLLDWQTKKQQILGALANLPE